MACHSDRIRKWRSWDLNPVPPSSEPIVLSLQQGFSAPASFTFQAGRSLLCELSHAASQDAEQHPWLHPLGACSTPSSPPPGL